MFPRGSPELGFLFQDLESRKEERHPVNKAALVPPGMWTHLSRAGGVCRGSGRASFPLCGGHWGCSPGRVLNARFLRPQFSCCFLAGASDPRPLCGGWSRPFSGPLAVSWVPWGSIPRVFGPWIHFPPLLSSLLTTFCPFLPSALHFCSAAAGQCPSCYLWPLRYFSLTPPGTLTTYGLSFSVWFVPSPSLQSCL